MFNQLLDDYEIIYNFEVEDLHNYYVGEEMILVHNDCRSLQRQQYWKNESYELKGENITYELTSENKSRMANGFAPKGFDNYSVELHHVKGIRKDFLDVVQIQKTDHILFHKIYGYKDFINIRTLAEFSSKIR